MNFDPKKLTNDQLKSFYNALLLPRTIEEKMMLLLRQGKISKWFSGWGQEAISVGATLAMNEDEIILPMHRNLGIFTTRKIPLKRLFAQFQGKEEGFTKGRDRSFHFGTMEHNLVGMISHLGPQLGIADGIGLSNKIDGITKATLVISGDGGASEGDFHEALNVAAVWGLPVIFLIESNHWGLSTPSKEQFNFESFVTKGPAYGMEAVSCNGNNILEVYHTVKTAADKIRKNPQPILIECKTFRIRGHEEASGTKYYPEGVVAEWEKEDPLVNYENWLIEKGIIDAGYKEQHKLNFTLQVKKAVEAADALPPISFDEENEVKDLFAEHVHIPIPCSEAKTEMRLIDSIHNGLKLAMQKHKNLILMGQDIAEYGGVFKATEGFVEEFGKDRVRNTPLCESAILGAALGLSISGKKAMVEMQFADFVTCGFNQIINNLAKIHWRWGQNADVVVRMPTGAGVAAGPFHSQSNEAWFFHTPGLKIVYPAYPEEAKGLLLASFEDPNPVLFFEHKALYRSIREDVSPDYYNIEIGKAKVQKEGQKISVITYGMGVHWAMDITSDFENEAIEIINLRTLSPLDWETIDKSVYKTGRVLVFHEDCQTGGIGAEIAAQIAERCFELLDAPVARLGSLDTPVPFAPVLEAGFLAKSKLKEKIQSLLDY
jgi:2-oxoisovalerate dehydrogenase E1 component